MSDPPVSVPGNVASGTATTTPATVPASTFNPSGVAAQSINSAGSLASTSATGTAAPSANASAIVAPPSAAVSGYLYQTYAAGAKVALGPQLAAMLGLSGTTVYTGNEIMNHLADASQGQLQEIGEFLYNAGYYVNDTGEQLQGGVVVGGMDIDIFQSMSLAILNTQTANATPGGTSTTVSDLLSAAVESGQGIEKIERGLTPVTGGGQTYQVNLTSPTDLYATAMQVFQQYLGRNPTSQELNAFVNGYNTLQTNYQTAQNTQKESMTRSIYQQNLASRQGINTPALASGRVPNGPFTSPSQWAIALLQTMSDAVTPANVALLTAWIAQNGGLQGAGKFNPLGVQGTMSGSSASSAGAQNYTTWSQGIAAASGLLASPQYQNLNDLLKSGSATMTSVTNAEIAQWSNGAITKLIPTKAQTTEANNAVKAYVPEEPAAQTTIPAANAPANPANALMPQGMNANNAAIGSGAPSNPATSNPLFPGMPGGQGQPTAPASTPASLASVAPGTSANNARIGGAQPGQPVSQTYTPPGQIQAGQGLTSPGDYYQPSSTLTDVTPPSPSSMAVQQATTGANAVPYLGNQYLQAYQTVLNYIKGEF